MTGRWADKSQTWENDKGCEKRREKAQNMKQHERIEVEVDGRRRKGRGDKGIVGVFPGGAQGKRVGGLISCN